MSRVMVIIEPSDYTVKRSIAQLHNSKGRAKLHDFAEARAICLANACFAAFLVGTCTSND